MKPFDPETGEVLQAVTIYKRSDEIALVLNPKDSGRGKRFVKVYNSRVAKRKARKLTLQQAGAIFKLSLYAQHETNIIVGDGEIGERGVPLTFEQIKQLLDVSEPTFLKLMRELKAVGAVLRLSRGYLLCEQIAGQRRG